MHHMRIQTEASQAGIFPDVGDKAPAFELPSIQGEQITLANYQPGHNVILWFSRGFTCNFCRGYMADLIAGQPALRAAGLEIIQVAPNLYQTAQDYFRADRPPFPFICDPDKRLYAVYGLGDAGALVATRNTVVSFAMAFGAGAGPETVRASWLDVANRNFVRRLHHHALTAMEQGVFIIDRQGTVRYRLTLDALAQIPTAAEFLEISEALAL